MKQISNERNWDDEKKSHNKSMKEMEFNKYTIYILI